MRRNSMEEKLQELSKTIEEKIPTIVDAIKNEPADSENYGKLLQNFNSSMVVYSELQAMFGQRARMDVTKEEIDNGSNN